MLRTRQAVTSKLLTYCRIMQILSILVLSMNVGVARSQDLPLQYRENMLSWSSSATSYRVIGGDFRVNELSITPGQDPQHKNNKGDVHGFSTSMPMMFTVGRKASSEVAQWWVSRIPAVRNTRNRDPDKLNFAFGGTLRISLTGGNFEDRTGLYEVEDIYIAQGSNLLENDWWIGGKTCRHETGSIPIIACNGFSPAGWPFVVRLTTPSLSSHEVIILSIEDAKFVKYSLQSNYIGENSRCILRFIEICPPLVIYFNKSYRDRWLKIDIKSERMYQDNRLFSTEFSDPVGILPDGQTINRAIFVIDEHLNMYATNRHHEGLVHHSSLNMGESVIFAGQMLAARGVIYQVDNCSGHYRPNETALVQLRQWLYWKGYSGEFEENDCSLLQGLNSESSRNERKRQ